MRSPLVDQGRVSSTSSTGGALTKRTALELFFLLFNCSAADSAQAKSLHAVNILVSHSILWGWQRLIARSSSLFIIRLC